MKSDRTLRTFFLIYIFLAYVIDNPFTGVFGGYSTFTGIPSNFVFANLSSVLKIPLPFSLYEWSLFLFAFLVFRRHPGFAGFPSGAIEAVACYWAYVLFWVLVSAFFLAADRQAIFWDFKGLVTVPFALFIFAKLFPRPEDWMAPIKVFGGAILFKCAQALFLNAFVFPSNHRVSVGYLIDHAASYQISTVLLVILGSILFKCWRPSGVLAAGKIGAIILVLLLAFVLNNRRTEMAGFAMSLLLMVAILATRRPKATIIMLPIAAVVLSGYVAAFANSQTVLGAPIRLLMSLNEDNNLSNLYRKIENYNLFFTLSENPFFGQGFGKPMKDVAGLSAFLDGDFFLLHPHNSILGLWSQAGIVGLAMFMLMFGVFAFHALRKVLCSADPLVLTMCVVSFSNMFRYVVFSTGDQIFLHSSSNLVLGASMGAIVVASQSVRTENPSGDTSIPVRGKERTFLR
jgi:O-antigen ligase